MRYGRGRIEDHPSSALHNRRGRLRGPAAAKLTAGSPPKEGISVQVTSIGHAGFRIETRAGSILCDPWVNAAYFASWFPFPDNSALDWDALGDCDYLYVSHLHKDHFDPENLRAHVNKDAVVLLPDYPVPDLQRELGKLGFHRFFETTNSVKHTVSGPKGDLDVMIIALRAPADGPIGDSGLVVSRPRHHCLQHERRTTHRPRRAVGRVRAGRRAHAAVLRGHLVPDGLRHAGPGQGGIRHAEAPTADGPLPPVHRPGGCHLGHPVGRTAMLSGPGLADAQRRPRRAGEHLPGPDGVPRADADARPRSRAADDPGLDRGVQRPGSGVARFIPFRSSRWRRFSPPGRPTTSSPTHSGWRR